MGSLSPAVDDSVSEITSRGATARDSGEPTVEVANRLFREELQGIRGEIREFWDELLELRSSLPQITARMHHFDRRLGDVEDRIAANVTDSAVKVLEEAVANFQLQLHDRDQVRLDNDLLITNVGEGAGGSILNIASVIGSQLGLKLDERLHGAAARDPSQCGLRGDRPVASCCALPSTAITAVQ